MPPSSDFDYERRIVSGSVVIWEMFGLPTDAQWRDLMIDAEYWLTEQESRGRKWGIIVDASGIVSLPADQRRAAGEWRGRHMPLIANTCHCASYVATSAWLRGAITAVFWFAKPVVPVSVRASQEDAHQWVITKLNDLGASS